MRNTSHMAAYALPAGATCNLPYRSWNYFRCNINDTLIREVADAMVATGLRDAGYVYVNIGEVLGGDSCPW